MTCTQPGCSGTITDGYCDVCGMAVGHPVQPSPQPGSQPPPTSQSQPTSTSPGTYGVPGTSTVGHRQGACERPGCPGTIVDGYCDVCGRAGGSSTESRRAGSHQTGSGPAGSSDADSMRAGSMRAGSLGTTPAPAASGSRAPAGAPQPSRSAAGIRRSQHTASPSSVGLGSSTGLGPSAASGSSDTQTQLGRRQGQCPQPGCTGVIVDGYCNLCGNPPQVASENAGSVLGTPIGARVLAERLGTILMGSALLGPDDARTPIRFTAGHQHSRIGEGITTVPPGPHCLLYTI